MNEATKDEKGPWWKFGKSKETTSQNDVASPTNLAKDAEDIRIANLPKDEEGILAGLDARNKASNEAFQQNLAKEQATARAAEDRARAEAQIAQKEAAAKAELAKQQKIVKKALERADAEHARMAAEQNGGAIELDNNVLEELPEDKEDRKTA